MREIDNRPIGCTNCGSMVTGRESVTQTSKGLLRECRWTCPRCGALVRVHEEYDNETE